MQRVTTGHTGALIDLFGLFPEAPRFVGEWLTPGWVEVSDDDAKLAEALLNETYGQKVCSLQPIH
jgi:hypothetical protein